MNKDTIFKILSTMFIIIACVLIGYSIDKHSWMAFFSGLGFALGASYLD